MRPHCNLLLYSALCYIPCMSPCDITQALARADLVPVLRWAQDFVRKASYDELRRQVHAQPAVYREHLVLLFRDVLAQYPHVVMGLPVLMRAEHDDGVPLVLPEPDTLPAGCRKMFWSALSLLGDAEPFVPRPGRIQVPLQQLACEVLIVECEEGVPVTLDNAWWSDLFVRAEGYRMMVSSRQILPYPDAFEAAHVIFQVANSGRVPQCASWLFLSCADADRAARWGHDWVYSDI